MYRINRRTTPTKEERVAQKIGVLLSDFSLDLESVGYHLAYSTPYVVYRRAVEVLEATEYNKEVAEYQEWGKAYDNRLL